MITLSSLSSVFFVVSFFSRFIFPFKSKIICSLNFGPIPGKLIKYFELLFNTASCISEIVLDASIASAPFGPRPLTLIRLINELFSSFD